MNRQHTRQRYQKVSYYQQLLQAIGQFLPARGLPLLVDARRTCWTPRMLAIGAILMCWVPSRTLTDRFGRAHDTLVGMYPSRRRPGHSYQGFMKALVRQSAALLAVVCAGLQKAVRQQAGSLWRFEGWLLFGVDGSRIDCPMTAANERAFGCAGKRKTGPQLLLTTLFHVGSGLIWVWRRGDAASSERGHLREMLDQLPAGALLLADAGFTGYALLCELLERRTHFVIRVGSNVRLLKNLGYRLREGDGIVSLWPTRQQERGQKPLVLRLIVLHDGKQTVYLLTDVLDERLLSDAQAGRMYRLRWTVELLFRAVKQTLEHRKMLSDSPRHAEVELDWTMVGFWMLGLNSLQALNEQGHRLDTWSVAASLRVMRHAMDKGQQNCRHGGLRESLGRCVKDSYVRHSRKQARHPKNKKTERPPGAPQIRMADPAEVLLAQQLRENECVA